MDSIPNSTETIADALFVVTAALQGLMDSPVLTLQVIIVISTSILSALIAYKAWMVILKSVVDAIYLAPVACRSLTEGIPKIDKSLS